VGNKIAPVFAILAFLFNLSVFAVGQQGHSEEMEGEGVVVAVHLDSDAARSPTDVNSESLGDFAEVWMVRIDRWFSPNDARYILLEYTHVNRLEPFVTDSELARTIWKFALNPVQENHRRTCSRWGERFVPTVSGTHEKLPSPKGLACFQTQQRPVRVGSVKKAVD
jgi:hypothetical protein